MSYLAQSPVFSLSILSYLYYKGKELLDFSLFLMSAAQQSSFDEHTLTF